MQPVNSFPAQAASSLIGGYCDDFVSLAASMAQTIEQVTMRQLPLDDCREQLARVERGMRQLADAIGGVLAQAPVATGSRRPAAASGPANPAPAPAGGRRQLPPAARERRQGRNPDAPARPASLPARPGPRAMPVAPAEGVPPPDDSIRRPAAETTGGTAPIVDATRLPARPTASSMLAGTNDTMPLRSVFQFLSRMRKSGTLRITVDTEELTFELSDGILVATKSTRMQQDERIGDLLIELGFMAPMDLEVFVKMHGQSLRQLGGALVQAGRITEGQLAEALERQVQRRFQRAVTAQKATYDFREAPRPRGDGRIRIRSFEMLSGEEPTE